MPISPGVIETLLFFCFHVFTALEKASSYPPWGSGPATRAAGPESHTLRGLKREDAMLKCFTVLSNPRLWFFFCGLCLAALIGLLAVLAPQQVPVAAYKLCLLLLAGIAG